ncbi:MAG: GreA/GreB family elongation factor [Steroidobacteraceae bacterium]
MNRERPIVITEPNARMLRALLSARSTTHHDQEHVHELRLELDRALVVEPSQMSAKVVTLHAAVRVLDLESGQQQEFVLVTPAEADVNARRISILAPLGTALLGYREGDEVEWRMPGGLRRLRIEGVVQAADSASVGSTMLPS